MRLAYPGVCAGVCKFDFSHRSCVDSGARVLVSKDVLQGQPAQGHQFGQTSDKLSAPLELVQ